MNKKTNPTQSKPEPAQFSNSASPSGNGDEKQKPVHAMLSPRQFQVAELVAQGLSDKEIGSALNLSEDTIGWHLKEIFCRCRVHSRAALAVCFLQTQPGKSEVLSQAYPTRTWGLKQSAISLECRNYEG